MMCHVDVIFWSTIPYGSLHKEIYRVVYMYSIADLYRPNLNVLQYNILFSFTLFLCL